MSKEKMIRLENERSFSDLFHKFIRMTIDTNEKRRIYKKKQSNPSKTNKYYSKNQTFISIQVRHILISLCQTFFFIKKEKKNNHLKGKIHLTLLSKKNTTKSSSYFFFLLNKMASIDQQRQLYQRLFRVKYVFFLIKFTK